MLQSLCCPENNRILVCVDAYEKGNPRGRFYNAFRETAEFSSLSRLLLQIEDMLNIRQTPQSYTAMRSFSSELCRREDGPEPAVSPGGNRATFELRILFRQHGSWQGVVCWKEGKREQNFRSVLELIHLMDSALRSPEDCGAA